MRRVSGKLNRVFVSVYLLLKDVRRHFRLADKALGDAAADVDCSRHARADSNLRHVQNVLHDVELKVVLLFKPRPGNAYSDPTFGDTRTKNRNTRFVSGGQDAVFRSNLSQFAAEQMQELAR